MKNSTKSAFILIDMEQGFIDPASAHCIKGAAATVPACEAAIQTARRKGIPVFFVKRIYREDGSDVDPLSKLGCRRPQYGARQLWRGGAGRSSPSGR